MRRLEQQPDARSGQVRTRTRRYSSPPGRKASQFIARTKRQLAAEFTYKDAPAFAEARAISKFAQDLFLKGEVDQVDILFTQFISTLVQKPEMIPLLPVGKIKAVTAGIGARRNRNCRERRHGGISF